MRSCRRALVLKRCYPQLSAPSKVPSSATAQQQAVPDVTLDAATIEKLKVAEEIGEKAFEENTEILKKMMLRGLRALLVGIVGFVAFAVAMKRRRRIEENEKQLVDDNGEDPTQRYLEEMRSLGFDVDGLEEELEAERKSASQSQRQGDKMK